MIKYVPDLTDIVIEEIPDKVTLAVEISNCQGSCVGCHSPFLRTDIGKELDESAVNALFSANFGVNCFLFLGEGNDREALLRIASYIRRKYPRVSLALYSGREDVEKEIWDAFDYVKVGPYIAARGPLNKPTTNQRLYHHGEDITARFWNRGLENRTK